MHVVYNTTEKCALLKSAFGHVHRSADGLNVACICPKCKLEGKQKVKLAVRLDNGCYHCWVCGIKGRSVTSLIRRYKRDLFAEACRFFPVPKIVVEDVQKQEVVVELPSKFLLLAENLNTRLPGPKSVIEYAYSRGLSVNDMWRYKLGFSTATGFDRRLIVPSFDAAGRLNYYTTRDVTDKMFPRYKNAPGRKQAIIYNELDIDWTSELLLVEGPFDVFKCQMNSTCMFGSSLDKQFLLFNKIIENGTPIILGLDQDATANSQKIAKLLYSFDIDVKIMSVDGYKDVGQMPRDVVQQRVSTAKIWSPESRIVSRISQIGSNTHSGLV